MFFKKKKPAPTEPAAIDLRIVSGEENPARDDRISDSLQQIGVENFPDNEHNTWSLLKTHHVGDRSYGLAEPEPKDVGYDRFVFVFRFDAGDSALVTLAIYSFEGEHYHLLATTPECHESLPRLLTW